MSLRVGVIGGGQLARMMIPPAIELGIHIEVLAETEGSSAQLAASRIGDYTNAELVREFASSVDVITFDHEHVPLDILRQLEAAKISVQPPSAALAHAQNKLTMRKALDRIGAPNPIWQAVKTAAELDSFISRHGPEVIVKTPIGGYDGKGVRVVSNSSEVSDWLAAPRLSELGGQLLVEEKVSFARELAQLCARNPSGEIACYRVVETRQQNGVCSEVIAPAPNMSDAGFARAKEIAVLIAQSLGVTGNLAVEMFETESGELLVNELAMRPHNSGHFSIDAAVTSQFEQHLRAVLDLPLGSTELVAPYAVMVNLLGVSDQDYLENYPALMQRYPEVKLHSYGKAPRVGRKLGHLNLSGSDPQQLLERALAARQLLLGE